MYVVIGADGVKLKSCKSLVSARKLADKESGVVLENGEQIYPVGNATSNADDTITETSPYEVNVRINIRSGPSLEVQKIGVAEAGTILEAFEDLGDWLRIRWNNGEAYARHKGFEYIKPVKR